MIIYINDKPAVLKAGSSFEYIVENRLFLGRDGYTMALTFPLNDCPQNRDIFGYINRMDVSKKKLLYECSIIDKGVSLFGTLQIIDISDSEVKAQFSEGRCEQIVTSSLDDIYINQLDLGEWPEYTPNEILPADALRRSNAVAFPWVNTAHPTPIQNQVDRNGEIFWRWSTETTKLSWQPFLLFITKNICSAIGYEYDFSEWEDSQFSHIIICNTLPAAWDIPQYAKAMPSWTVSEFFEKLELFMACEFDFDHRAKTVSFRFSKSVIDKLPEVQITSVVDSYNVKVSKEDNSSCDYIGVKNLVYKDGGHQLSNYYNCSWMMESWPEKEIVRYDTMSELLEKNPYPSTYWTGYTFHVDNLYGIPQNGSSGRPNVGVPHNGYPAFFLLYAKDVDTYFSYRSIGLVPAPSVEGFPPGFLFDSFKYQDYELRPVNVFGSMNPNVDDTEEIEFVPVCIDYTDNDHGYAMFLSPSEFNESAIEDDFSHTDVAQLRVAQTIEQGEIERGSAYYDTIYVAFAQVEGEASVRNMPYPIIDFVSMWKKDYFSYPKDYSIRRSGPSTPLVMQLPKIDPLCKFNFSFLADSIPNPRAIFNIAGKRYICEKITATFTEEGMSQLLKGEFYPLIED